MCMQVQKRLHVHSYILIHVYPCKCVYFYICVLNCKYTNTESAYDHN